MLASASITDFTALVARWAEMSTEVVQQSPDDSAEATPDSALLQDIGRRADW